MEIAKLRHLAEELKEVPYIGSDVTHVFSLDEKELVMLKYHKELDLYRVTAMDRKIAADYKRADQAASAIKATLDAYYKNKKHGRSS
ncbi:hypothetical protein DRW41_04375 [Neobacillus piezotolerans]|uniref:Uncharacterized protein n=1 Tax=Neobacillus piezotolerans TaxID=2259171 RepID=A0A3D8GX85_9BACI|nr:hypothetical protein [Neobacillus piezotolerans]RDU38801.1 hypothetical protein DRW41_04375 [Neobacillus piezotolerans]